MSDELVGERDKVDLREIDPLWRPTRSIFLRQKMRVIIQQARKIDAHYQEAQ
jgi:hypothetical protein